MATARLGYVKKATKRFNVHVMERWSVAIRGTLECGMAAQDDPELSLARMVVGHISARSPQKTNQVDQLSRAPHPERG